MILSNIRSLPICTPVIPPQQQTYYMFCMGNSVQVSPDYCSWLVTPVDISNPQDGFVLSANGHFVSTQICVLPNGNTCLASTTIMDSAARVMPVEENGGFYLQLIGTSAVLTMNIQGMFTIFDELRSNNSNIVCQYWVVNNEAEYDSDGDQYCWIFNNLTGGVLSLNGNFCSGAILTTQKCMVSYDQLWKFKYNSLISRANGFVLEVNKIDNSVLAGPIIDSLINNQLFEILGDGTIRALQGNVELHAQEDRLGSTVIANGATTPSEWYFVPFVSAPDVTENQLDGIDENDAFVIRNASNGRVLTTPFDIQPGTPLQLLNELHTKSSWENINTQDLGQCISIAAGDSTNVWVIAKSRIEILKYTGDDTAPWIKLDNYLDLQSISIGADGTVWGVSTSADVYRLDGESWTRIPGWFRQVSVGSAQNVWGVTPDAYVFKYTGDDTNPWQQVNGQLESISVGIDGAVWGVSLNGSICCLDNKQWKLISSDFRVASVAVGSQGKVWVVDSYGNVYQYSGDETSPWVQVPGQMYQISVAGDGVVWGINFDMVVCRNVPGPAAENQQWYYDNGLIKSVNGNYVIEAGLNGLILSPCNGIANPNQNWILTSKGYFMLDQPDAQLVVPVQTDNFLTYSNYSPLKPAAQVWFVEYSQVMSCFGMCSLSTYKGVSDVVVTSLKVIAVVSNGWWSGTTDRITISISSKPARQLLFNNPSRGARVQIEVDLLKMFGHNSIMLSDIRAVSLFQIPTPHPLASDDWELKSLVLVVNNRYYNSYANINEVLGNPLIYEMRVWSRFIKLGSWSDLASDNRSNWMTSNYNLISSKTLRQLALPGSHDAGMYTGDPFYFLGKTQDISIYDQLCEGVRYFDLRPGWVRDPEDGSYYFVVMHGPIWGALLLDILVDVAKFMNEPGRRELVILKFSHYYNLNGLVYGKMVSLIKERLGGWLCERTPGMRLADTPMSNFIAINGAVMVVCDGDYPIKNAVPGIYTYRDWNSSNPKNGDLTVYDVYSDTTDLEKMKSDQVNKFQSFNGKCKNDPNVQCDLFLLSWTLTPITAVWFYAKMANECLYSSVTALSNPNSYGQRINIVYVDYVQYYESVNTKDVCLKLNGIK